MVGGEGDDRWVQFYHLSVEVILYLILNFPFVEYLYATDLFLSNGLQHFHQHFAILLHPTFPNIFDLFLDNFNNFLLQVVEVFLFDGEQGPNFRYFRVNQIDDLFFFFFVLVLLDFVIGTSELKVNVAAV